MKGSFTGAIKDKIGLFAAASKGTFFLDEIGETTPATQVKLLRVLQHREVIPVGATDPMPIDVRLLAATNRDLDEEMRRGGFRSDLYYRLNVISLHLPTLRQRADDIPLLAEYFLARIAELRQEEQKTLSADDARGAVNYTLARQRARAGERARARGHPHVARRDRTDRAARARHASG